MQLSDRDRLAALAKDRETFEDMRAALVRMRGLAKATRQATDATSAAQLRERRAVERANLDAAHAKMIASHAETMSVLDPDGSLRAAYDARRRTVRGRIAIALRLLALLIVPRTLRRWQRRIRRSRGRAA